VSTLLGIPGLEAVEPTGANGFATTYGAFDTDIGQAVTVEVLPPVTGNDEALRRFEATLRALYAKPRHPAILQIRELGQLEDGRPYVITLQSNSRSLADRTSEVRLSSAEVAALGASLADALALAHERGVLHGDVRLDHVRLTEEGDPIIGAFGYERLARTLRTGRSDLVTSLTNASPEVLSGGVPDAAADVWALSCCLHQLLLGRSPFGLSGHASLPEIVERVVHQPLEDLRAAGVADDLATVLEAALQRDRSVRLATATSLRRALRGVGRIYGQPRPGGPVAPEFPDLEAQNTWPDPLAVDGPPQQPTPPPPTTTSWETSSQEQGAATGDPAQAQVRRQLLVLVALTVALLGVLTMSVRALAQ